MDGFECAFGQCAVNDGVLTIERSNPEKMGRWEVFRTGLATSWNHQPRRTVLWLGRTALLGVVFIGLVMILYTEFSVRIPFVIGLSFLGLLALFVPLEVTYRQAVRERCRIQQTLADETRVSYPEQLPLDDITNVSVQEVSTGAFLTDGHLVLVEFHRAGAPAITYLGFPEFMSDELDTALSLFKQCEIPITEERQ